MAKSLFFPRLFNVLGPCWAFFGVRKQLPPTLSLSVSGFQPPRSGLQLVAVKVPQEPRGYFGSSWGFLDAKKVYDSSIMASRWLKMACRWPVDGLKRANDDSKMAQDGL